MVEQPGKTEAMTLLLLLVLRLDWLVALNRLEFAQGKDEGRLREHHGRGCRCGDGRRPFGGGASALLLLVMLLP